MFKDPVLIDTDGQLDSFWGLVLAKRLFRCKSCYSMWRKK